MSSSESELVVPLVTERSSIPEMICLLRSSFQQKEYDEVERLLISREEKLKIELRNLKMDYDWMKRKHDSLEIERLEIKAELKKCKLKYEEYREQLIRMNEKLKEVGNEKNTMFAELSNENEELKKEFKETGIEKNRMIEELTRDKNEAVMTVALRNSQLVEYDFRISNLEVIVAEILGVDVMDLRSGVYSEDARKVEMDFPLSGAERESCGNGHLPNGVNFPINEGENEGPTIENVQNGANDHVEGESGGVGVENLQNGLNGYVENHTSDGIVENHKLEPLSTPSTETLVNGLDEVCVSPRVQSAHNSTRTQSSDLPIEETVANGHVNAEISSGEQPTFNCPQVESNASNQEKENDESSGTAFISKNAACGSETGFQRRLVHETESSSQATNSCIPDSKEPGSCIIIDINDSDEENLTAGSAHATDFFASGYNSIGKKLPSSKSGKITSFIQIEEENGSDGIKDSNIHLNPKRKRSTTESNDTGNFIPARRKTKNFGQLLLDGKGSLLDDSSVKPNLTFTGCQRPILPTMQSDLVSKKCQEKARPDGSLRLPSKNLLFDDTDDSSEDESNFASCMENMIASLRRDMKKTWKFAADMLSAFEKDYELCMNAVCALYRKKISAEKSIMKSSNPADLGFYHFDAMSGKDLAEFLTDGDPQHKLKRTVTEVKPEVLSKCKDIAIQYSDKLFEIYRKKEDPFFRPKF